ncbi:MAG: hypothetical protein WEB00_15035 [Dehalococcoidia bacterium]
MNKLRDKIRDASSSRASGLGFGATRSKKTATLLLLVHGERSSLAAITDADAYLVPSAADRPTGDKEAVSGLILGKNGASPADGFDFLVIDETTPAAALLNEDVGYLMRATPDIPDSFLRALQSLPLDGLIVTASGDITVREQVEMARLAGFTGKPLFVEVAPDVASKQLEVLREAGAVGLIADAARGAEAIAGLRRTISALPPRRKRVREERDAVSVAMPAASSEDEADFDDD